MCGIVGYIGKKQASQIIIDCLSRLEYRGYDSAGAAIINSINNTLYTRKFQGRLITLSSNLKTHPIKGNIGIGHTRWATHGEPSDLNSHPHLNNKGTIAVVHNGIIENYLELRNWLKDKGYSFISDTDTEVIPNLIDYFYQDNLFDALAKTVKMLQGSYAIGAICQNEPDKIVAVRKDSPLIVGLGEDEYFIASDIPATLKYTRNTYLLNNLEFVILTKDGVTIKSAEGNLISKAIHNVTWSLDAAEKDGYADFMLKEIYEEPKSIKNTFSGKIAPDKPVELEGISFTKAELEKFDKIFVVACGTAYYAGIIGKYVLESTTGITVETDIASEFRYRQVKITPDSLLIVVSQSGETADTLAVLRKGKSNGAKVLAITNVVGSSVAREADQVFYTLAGPEIAVASTKAFVSQLTAFYMISLYFSEILGTLSLSEINTIKSELILIPNKINKVFSNIKPLKDYAKAHYKFHDIFYLGRGLDFAIALEGSLKLKEISYIHSEAYAGGELKHGPIALIEKGTPVITLLTQESLKAKMISNTKEVATRGGNIFSIVNEDDKVAAEFSNSIFHIPKTIDLLTPLISVIPLQLIAYYIAKEKQLDVDKPRNLAKSVTVE